MRAVFVPEQDTVAARYDDNNNRSDLKTQRDVRVVFRVSPIPLLSQVRNSFPSCGDPEFCEGCSGLQNTAVRSATICSWLRVCCASSGTLHQVLQASLSTNKCRCCGGYLHGICGVQDPLCAAPRLTASARGGAALFQVTAAWRLLRPSALLPGRMHSRFFPLAVTL